MERDGSEGKDEQDVATAMNGDGDAAFLIGDTCKIIPCEKGKKRALSTLTRYRRPSALGPEPTRRPELNPIW
jgi:hypothetical protein